MFTIDTNILIYSAAGDSKVSDFISQQFLENKLKLADSIIAASALQTNSTLVTRNTVDFKKIPKLKLLAI